MKYHWLTKLLSAFFIVTLVLAAMPVPSAYADTASRYAASGATSGGAGTAWTTPAGALSSDDTNYATVDLATSQTSEYLLATNFGFTIPLNATINGIQVTIMRQSSSSGGNNSIDDQDLYLRKTTTNIGNDHASGNDWPTSMQAATYGTTSDLWGTTWTPAEINASTFGVALSVLNESGFSGRTASVDYIQVTVTYTLPTTTVGDGTSPSSKAVGGASANNAVSAFTLAANSGTDTITGLVITGGGTGLANVAANGVKIYRSTNSEWDAGDTLIGTASFVGATATFTGLNIAVTTASTNYIVTYDIVVSPTAGQTMTGFVSGATATNTVMNNDNTDATLTIGYTITVTAGTGGTIQYPSGTIVTTIMVAPNATVDVFSVPDAGFVLANVQVDGISVGRANTYRFQNVAANHTLSATFDGGWYRPSAMGTGSNWTNTANGYTSNNSWATSDDFPGENANYINFNIPTIPAGSTINGIEVAYEGWTGNTNANVAISGDFGSSFAPTSFLTTFIPDVPDRTVILGGSTNTWGSSTWAPNDFTNAEFYLRISSDNYAQLYLDQVQVKVYYTPPPLTVTIEQAAGQPDPTNASPINFTVVFNHAVSDFTDADVTLSGTAGATTAVVTGSGTTYNVAVSGMTGEGTVIASLAAGVATDANGAINEASASTDNTVTHEITAPTVTINQAAGQDDPTNAEPINFTVVFSEPVTGFDETDVTLSGTANAITVVVTGSGITYNVAVSGMANDGTVIAEVNANAAQDTAGNNSIASASTDNTVTYDATDPTVTIEQAAGQADPTNSSPINFTVTFSEPVSGFDETDVTLGGTANATTVVVTGSGTTYNVAVSGMANDGTVTATVGASAAQDAAGNNSAASTSTDNTVTYDTTAPTVTINQAAGQPDPTDSSPVTFTVMFSEPVTGFDETDILLGGTGGATTINVSGSGTTYTVTLSGLTDGTLIPSIPANSAQDTAGNGNAASTSADNSVTYDTTDPTVTINQAAGQSDPTNASPVNFTVIFSEPVTGFDETDVVLGGTAGATTVVVTGSGATYNVAVSGMSADGTVVADIPANAAQDATGNTSDASTSTDNSVLYDVIPPSVTINQAAGQIDPTNAEPINFTVVFSEPVTGFDETDVTLSGTANATTVVVTGSGATYNVAVSGMIGDGTVIASIAADVATDIGGNNNLASTSSDNSVTYDTTVPTVTIEQAIGQADPTNVSPITFTVVFSEPVTGFDETDVTLGGTAGATTVVVTGSGATYSVEVGGMTGDGTVIVDIPLGSAQDTSGNGNAASASVDNSVTYDTTAPTVTVNQSAGQDDPASGEPIYFTVVFSEPVTGFTNAGVALSGTANATTAVVTGSGATYIVAVSGMANDGTVIADVLANAAQDAAGNNSTASASADNVVTYDTTNPSVTIDQASGQADPTNTGPINFTVAFSELVTGFTDADIILGGTAGATTMVVTGSGATYNVAVTGMAADGTVIVTIPAGRALDASGNGNTASASADNVVTYDTTRPTVTIDQAAGQPDPTNTGPINFTVVFSETVTGFDETDITLTGTAGATTVAVTGSGDTYNVAVTGMTGNGTVTVAVLVNAALDLANNSSFASTSADNTVTFDIVAPSVTINQAATQADPSGASPLDFTVVFSEPMTGFTGADVVLSGTAGATTAVVSGSGTTYTVAVSGMTNSGTVIATIPAGGAQDLAGNGNTASVSTDNTITYDITLPAVTIDQAIGQADPTNGSPINFTVLFSEPMTGFSSADIVLSGTANATTAVVTGGGLVYNVAVSGMANSGTVIASIPANAATDASGNGNSASTSSDNVVNYDLTRPTVTIEQAAGQSDPTGISPINFTVVFSEPVTDFTFADIALSGTAGAATAVVSGGGDTYNVAVSGMTGSGTVIAAVNAGAATDLANNTSFASTSTDNTVTYDNIAPTVTINQAAGQADPTNLFPINFTVVFSEPVTGFTAADVSLSGTAGAITAVVTGSGTTYNVAVSNMAGSGTVIATIPAGNAQDAAGNVNANSTSTDNTVTFDASAPTVTINQAAGQADPTGASPISFDVVFSKPVTGFTNADIILSGTAGATTALVTGSGTTYNVAVSGMTGDGTVIASIPAGVATDSVGNPNSASSSTDNSVTYDRTGPTVTINQAAGQPDPTGFSPINFAVVFSEPVTGFTVADLNLGGTAGATTAVITGSGATYNVAISDMTGSGTVIVSITDSAVTDAAGNLSAASTSTDNVVTYDTGAPGVTINQAASQADPTNTSPISFTVIFSKPVTGFTNADVVITGTAGAATVVVTGSGTTYGVEVSGMAGTGTVIATIPADRAQDSAGNGNTASTSADNSVTYDISGPSVTIDQASGQADPTNTSPINFTVEFSEPVTGFTSSGVTLGGTAGPTTAVVTGSGTTYNIAVSGMITDGTVTATIGDNVATDSTGNPNSASTSADNEITYSTTNPTVTINQAAVQSDPTNISPINFTVVFSKLVTGFTDSDIVIGGTAGATTATVTGSGLTYNVAVMGMTNDGTVVVSIPGGVVTDASGNLNTPSTSADNSVLYYDSTGPSVMEVRTSVGGLNDGAVLKVGVNQFSVKFSQDVFDPAGDGGANDVTNPDNYILVRDLGDTAGFQTVSCAAGAVTPADTRIVVGTVAYDATTFTSTFTVNSSLSLSNGKYRLFVCGTTSIVDPVDNTLRLVGSSGPNTDFIRTFDVNISSGGGGGGGGGGDGETGSRAKSVATTTGASIPVTGFAPGMVTKLPEQPADRAYAEMSDMRLEIPSLSLNIPIVGVKMTRSGWDLTWLGNSAGYLEGSAYPTWAGNTVLTGHVLDERNAPGAFAYIKELKSGDLIFIRAYGWTYVYQVEDSALVKPHKVNDVFKHEEYNWLTLVTCENFSAKAEDYLSRRVVRAVLISVLTDQ